MEDLSKLLKGFHFDKIFSADAATGRVTANLRAIQR
jgi:hypothetical protein